MNFSPLLLLALPEIDLESIFVFYLIENMGSRVMRLKEHMNYSLVEFISLLIQIYLKNAAQHGKVEMSERLL